MPIAITEQQRAIQASVRRWADGGHTLLAVRGREPGRPGGVGPIDPKYWTELAQLGLFCLAVAERAGGAGAEAVDLAAALEQVGDALVPGPIMPTLLAGVLLSPYADQPLVHDALSAIAAGQASVAVAVDAGTLTATPRAVADGGGVDVHGRVGPVLGAGDASHLLLCAAGPAGPVWFLVEADHPGVSVTDRVPVDFSRTLADIGVAGVVPAHRCLAAGTGPTAAWVREVAAWLGAVEAAAVADWCLRTASAYALVRQQFGRPIGSFQAVKHLCAGMLCRAERATATAWDASVAFDQAPAEFPLAAAVAATVALTAAVDNAKDCVQVLGGIGFTWEHDAHLYLRRAVALRQLLGGPSWWRARVAALALGGARRRLRAPAMGQDEPVRRQVRARIADIAAEPVDRRRAALADAGLLTPHWPAPYGVDATPADQLVIDEELDRAGLSRPDLAIAGWAVPTILAHGTQAQRHRFAGPSLRGEVTWCQLFSEPEAGSDLAAVRTRAVRADGGWRLSGQKVWTSLAHRADWAICLARTDPAAAKHRGLGYFLVAMSSAGLDIRPLREMTGAAMFNEVFLDDVFVPDDCLVGEPGDGWRLARSTLAHERVAMGRGSSLGEDLERLAGYVASAGIADEPGVRDQLGALVADGLAVSLVDFRGTLRRLAGQPAGAESAVAKLIGVAQRQAVAEAALSLRGAGGAIADEALAEMDAGTVEQTGREADVVHQFLLSRCLSIAGGTTQILSTLVAERVLGLPREEVR